MVRLVMEEMETFVEKSGVVRVCVELMLIVTPAVGTSGKVFAVTEVTIAKELGPPPLRAQKRSGFSLALAVTYLPSAVTASKQRTLSAPMP